MQLSKNFTLEEYINSATAKRRGINNTPSAEVQANIEALNKNIMQPIRDAWGQPIVISSGYRSANLNKAVGGAKTSQHLTGEACDFHTTSDTLADNLKLWKLIQKLNLPFDQLIYEYGERGKGPDWIHVSYSPRNRRQVLYIGCK